MRRTLVLNVVGLTPELIGEHTPNLMRLGAEGGQRSIRVMTPAVTCSAQATYLTGEPVSGHGIVGNGWYFRDLSEVMFWRQSNHLVSGEKIWETGRKRDSAFTCANLFWWYNMYSSVDFSATPRPMYPADGRKIPDCYTEPSDLRNALQSKLGQFPLFKFWGPTASLESSQWIARSAEYVEARFRPTLNLVYLPHLDYNLQRLGPDHPAIAKDLVEVDALCGELITMAHSQGISVVVLSEYGITPVKGAVAINRTLREAGLLTVREEQGRELLDAGASEVFAVVDHQLAHIYIKQKERIDEVRGLLQGLDGVDTVCDRAALREMGWQHERAGELIAFSDEDRWFSYYYWLSPECAPDFARTVDIHRKPGYDPAELFFDSSRPMVKGRAFGKLALRKLGFRSLLDVIPLDPSLVRGSHGRFPSNPSRGPLLITDQAELLSDGVIPATSVKELLLQHVFG